MMNPCTKWVRLKTNDKKVMPIIVKNSKFALFPWSTVCEFIKTDLSINLCDLYLCTLNVLWIVTYRRLGLLSTCTHKSDR